MAFELNNSIIYVTGNLFLAESTKIVGDLKSLLHSHPDLNSMDFSKVQHCDSVGILIMLNAKRYGHSDFSFKHVPQRLEALLTLTHLKKEFIHD